MVHAILVHNNLRPGVFYSDFVFNELEQKEKSMNSQTPNRKDSLKLFKEFVLFSNVEKHCVAAATVATYLAKKFNKLKKAGLNLDLVFAISLFHDLAKASQIKTLEAKKFDFKPLTKKQKDRWKMLREVSLSLEKLFAELNKVYPALNKKIHETDVAAIIIGNAFPALLPYINQIGGTHNEAYFFAGWEIKLTHYADWILHGSDLIPFAARLNYLLDTYATDLTLAQKTARKQKEKQLEKELFTGLDITPNLNVAELNKLKQELFGKDYDWFKIGKIAKIE